MDEKIAVIGLGYVGLPLAVALAEKFENVVGIDISQRRVDALKAADDWTGEVESDRLEKCSIEYTCDPRDLEGRSVFIVTVPTPIDDERRPDLEPIRSACRLIGPYLSQGSVVVFESTVYPGVTEDVAGTYLEELSGLKSGVDFKLGYSPERINPGDKVHRLETITKVVAAQDMETLDRISEIYGAIIDAGLHRAPTIRVAEAAKVIENTQRDINIALMNEIALIFDRMDIRTSDVLAAAGTKWNFLPFRPGLVGGHCIGVDPYYLTAAAEKVGVQPHVILSGRRINDGMGAAIAQKTIKLLAKADRPVRGSRVAVMGLTFKENVPDLRNSKVPDIIQELRDFGIEPIIHDPVADPADAKREYGVDLSGEKALTDLDALILAVGHDEFASLTGRLGGILSPNAVVVDVKSFLSPQDMPESVAYWSL